MKKRIDLNGRRYGKLLVVGDAYKRGAYFWWPCVCDCGVKVDRNQSSLQSGNTTSCGCNKAVQNAGHFKTTHGATPRGESTPLKRAYRIWATMKGRTLRPGAHAYERYGGAGIQVCDRWLEFEAFLEDMGAPPSDKHTLDRMDSSKGYSKDNCRWATYTEQNRNRSNTIKVDFEGETVYLAELSERFGISRKVVYMRVTRYGWSLRDALTVPAGGRRPL